jgi:hypothetical protein
VKIMPIQNKSKFAKEASERPGVLYPMLQAMDVRHQIKAIKSSSIFKNAFIDLIIYEQIPRVIIDHDNKTVFPFDEDSRYSNGNSENYTIILNMKYIIKNSLYTYVPNCQNRRNGTYTDKFKELLRKYAYYCYSLYDDSCDDDCDDDYGYYDDIGSDEFGKSSLISAITKYLVSKAWAGEDDDQEYSARDLRKTCRSIFYLSLEDDIGDLEYYYTKGKTIGGRMCRFNKFAAELGIDLRISKDDRVNMNIDDKLKEIEMACENDIDKKVSIMVEELRDYELSDVYKNHSKKNLSVNLLHDDGWLFHKSPLEDILPEKLAKVYYYYQKEEYVKSDICKLDIAIPSSHHVGININNLNGSFPNVNELPDDFGASLVFMTRTSNLKLPDFPNVTTIGSNAMSSLILNSITFGKMDKLKTIGDNFCDSSTAEIIDLQGLENVETICNRFLYKVTTCKILFPPFFLLKKIGNEYAKRASIGHEESGLDVLRILSRVRENH